MVDNRIQAYARLLVEDCIDVQPGWQVLVAASALARPLAKEVMCQVAARRAYAIPRVSFSGVSAIVELPWLQEAPLELRRMQRYADRIDAADGIRILAEDTADGALVQRNGKWLV